MTNDSTKPRPTITEMYAADEAARKGVACATCGHPGERHTRPSPGNDTGCTVCRCWAFIPPREG